MRVIAGASDAVDIYQTDSDLVVVSANCIDTLRFNLANGAPYCGGQFDPSVYRPPVCCV
jgi:hypothetical protein